jgi:hypothetical protein
VKSNIEYNIWEKINKKRTWSVPEGEGKLTVVAAFDRGFEISNTILGPSSKSTFI